jgi:CheY-like chemotaxis protein
MKIMVVDDEQDVQLLFQQRFKKEIKSGRIEFHFALSGEDALKFLDKQDATDHVLILSDINMPGMNGLELLKRIKAKYPHPRVFMITAYGDESNYRQSLEYGCAGYLTKPLDFGMLKKKIFGEETVD